MTTKTEARAQALVQYTHAKVRDRYDADLLMAGFEDGAEWQASRKVEVIDEKRATLSRSIKHWTPALVRKYEQKAYEYMAEMATALGGGE